MVSDRQWSNEQKIKTHTNVPVVVVACICLSQTPKSKSKSPMHRLKETNSKINRNKKFLLKLIGFACIISKYFQIFQACHLVCHSHNPAFGSACLCKCRKEFGIIIVLKKLQYSIYAVNELNIHMNERKNRHIDWLLRSATECNGLELSDSPNKKVLEMYEVLNKKYDSSHCSENFITHHVLGVFDMNLRWNRMRYFKLNLDVLTHISINISYAILVAILAATSAHKRTCTHTDMRRRESEIHIRHILK